MCFSHKCERVQEDRHQLGTAKDGMIVDNINNSEKRICVLGIKQLRFWIVYAEGDSC